MVSIELKEVVIFSGLVFIVLFLILMKDKLGKKKTEEKVENFEETETTKELLEPLLNSIDSTNKTVAGIFNNVTSDSATVVKNLSTTKNISASNTGVNATISADVINGKTVSSAKDVIASNALKGKYLCLGNTCITEEHLKILTGARDVFIRGKDTGRILSDQNGSAKFQGNKASWERMRFIL